MIGFACHCGYSFSVPQDLAGGLIQCPQCHRLNDVPLLSDLPNIDDGGIYKLDDAPKLQEGAQRVEKLTRVFTRDHYDADGLPIDNRQTPEEVSLAGEGVVHPSQTRGAPKYDPITGELVRELEVKPDIRPDPASIPMARRVMTPPKIVNGMDVPDALEVVAIPMRLCKPINLLVMGFILLGHLLGAVMMACIASFYWVLAPFWLGLQMLMVSHFGNVIDEMGPSSKDELPAPLRTVDIGDDVIAPMWNLMVALAFSYLPAAAAFFFAYDKVPLAITLGVSIALAIAGTILFPAAAITTMTSGSVLNLRPDRVVGVARVCGAEYAVSALAFAGGIGFYLAGVFGVNWLGAWVLNDSVKRQTPPWLSWYASYGCLIVGI